MPQAKQNRATSGFSWPQAAHVAMGELYDGNDGSVNRRLRLVLGGTAALVIAGVLVAPVVLSGAPAGSCSMSLSYLGRAYTVRSAGGADAVQALAIGVGITRGCGSKPENVGVRSLAGVSPASAVAVAGDASSIYVRRGVCVHSAPRALLACLKR
jgi:hypothetical protein